MRLPRDVGGADPAKKLERYGCQRTRQTGSHMRLTTQRGGEHHITIPRHDSLRLGTLSAIVREVADHLGKSRTELIEELFG